MEQHSPLFVLLHCGSLFSSLPGTNRFLPQSAPSPAGIPPSSLPASPGHPVMRTYESPSVWSDKRKWHSSKRIAFAWRASSSWGETMRESSSCQWWILLSWQPCCHAHLCTSLLWRFVVECLAGDPPAKSQSKRSVHTSNFDILNHSMMIKTAYLSGVQNLRGFLMYPCM